MAVFRGALNALLLVLLDAALAGREAGEDADGVSLLQQRGQDARFFFSRRRRAESEPPIFHGRDWYAARAAMAAYRDGFYGDLINTASEVKVLEKVAKLLGDKLLGDMDAKVQELNDGGWESAMKFDVLAPMGYEYGEDFAELWKKDAGEASEECMLVFRGSDDTKDFLNDLNTKPTDYMGSTGLSTGVVDEFDPLVKRIAETGGFEEMRNCSLLTVTGHSLGAACAGLFAALANKADDPLGANLTVHYLYEFGGMPISSEPLTNDKSEDGCFEGARFHNVQNLRTDFAIWVGNLLSKLEHPKIRAVGLSSGEVEEDLPCSDGSLKPSAFAMEAQSVALHMPGLYLVNMGAGFETE